MKIQLLTLLTLISPLAHAGVVSGTVTATDGSPVTIRVTDPHGHTYTQTLPRP